MRTRIRLLFAVATCAATATIIAAAPEILPPVKLRVAGAQISVVRDISANVAAIERAIAFAAAEKADVLVTPEGALSGYVHDFDQAAVARALDQVVAKAREARLALALGVCFEEAEDHQRYDEIRFYDKDGAFVGFHAKILLCRKMSAPPDTPGEIDYFRSKPLRAFQFSSLPGLTFGGLICNDLWANPEWTPQADPHLTQQLARMGARVIFQSVNSGLGQGEELLLNRQFHDANLRIRARSGHQWIVVADASDPASHRANQCQSGVLDPTGTWIVKAAPVGEQMFAQTIDLASQGNEIKNADSPTVDTVRSKSSGPGPRPDTSPAMMKKDGGTASSRLPGQYFQFLQAGVARVEQRLAAEPIADLQTLESFPGWRHFPSALLVAAVLYAEDHPANLRHGDAKLLALAQSIGDLLTSEHAKGRYTTRLDHHRDTYMWLEAYRLLEQRLGDERRDRWRNALTNLIGMLAKDVAEKQDYPWYQSPFISTSPNHYALWAKTVYLGGKVLRNSEWERLGTRVMHRFAAEEQTSDGYWGEWTRSGPTTGYDYLTLTGVALYYEHSHDPAALDALRRSTDFHKFFTWPDGTPVETINDRNRSWGVSPWGHFGFSHFPDGRRYAEFLTSFLSPDALDLESLGRLAQDALYFHEGPTAPIPQDMPRYAHQMSVPAGIRKTGPWVVCLSGLIATPTPSRWYLDRQGHLSVFHEKLGLILTGANSKNQPELATFTEREDERIVHTPTSSRLKMSEDLDQLSLAYDSFFAVLEVPPAADKRQDFRLVITPTGRMAEVDLNLQLILQLGVALETAAGRKAVLDEKAIRWDADDVGNWIRQGGWKLRLPPGARLTWPVYPFNPYRNGPETGVAHAVGTISVRLTGKQTLAFAVEVDE